jgi:arylsulfatase A-like enzyme
MLLQLTGRSGADEGGRASYLARMRASRWLVVAGAGLALAVTAAALWGAGQSRPHPNVLIVLWDTVRADRMSLYGYGRPTTPRLDQFAQQAAVYERATSPGMWTLNTHAAMFTGLYESSHGARPSWRWLDQRHTTLAELARAAGYDTFLFSANLIASPMTNLTQGFDTVHTAFPRDGEPKGRYIKAAKQAARRKRIEQDASTEISPMFAGRRDDEWDKSVFKDAAPVAHQALVDWLGERQEPERPFFAYLNLMEAHSPRIPSLSARRRVADEATIETALATDLSLFAANEYIIGRRDYTPEQLAAIGATYDAALVDLDDATGDLLDDLRGRGMLEDTVVVVVADHGEHLGEHRFFEHRWSMYEPLLHVPLVIWYPEKIPAGRISERVNTIDLYATLVELAGLDSLGPTFSTSLVGRERWDPYVFSQMLDPFASQLQSVQDAYPDDDLSRWARTYCAIYEGDHKLIVSSDGQHELYDLAQDRGELTNRLEQDTARRDALLGALDRFEEALPQYDPGLRAPQDKPRRAVSEEKAMLELLGYVDGEAQAPLRDFCGRRSETKKP